MENKYIKVSVIIPVYNTERYVQAAVKSIMCQSFKDLEIIIINDGSTDRSLELVEELKDTDNRIKVYSQTNQGLSITRNVGMSHAHGEYIYFMDSDDLLEKDAIELCYHKCEEEKLDFIFFDALSFFEDSIENAPSLNYIRTNKFSDKIYTGIEALKIQLDNWIYTPSACLNFIRKSFIENHHLLFYPHIVHEDQLFTTLLYLQSKRTACIKRTFFQRRIRKDSIMTRKFTSQNMEGYFIVTQEILKFKKQSTQTETKAIIDLYLSQMLNAAVWQAHTLKLQQRFRLALLCLNKYKKYVSIKTIGALLFKSMLANQKNE